MIRFFSLLFIAVSAVAQPFMLNDAVVWNIQRAEAAAPSGGISIQYIGNYSTNATLSSYTFPTSFGAEAADRYIVAVWGSRDSGTGLEVTSFNIGGVASTLLVGTNDVAANLTMMQIRSVALPTGTSGTVEITFNESTLRGNLAIYRVTGINPALWNAAGDITPTTMTLNLTGYSGGGIIAGVFSGSTTSASWTGATELYDVAAGTATASGATNLAPTVGSHVVTVTISGNTAAAGVSFAPL